MRLFVAVELSKKVKEELGAIQAALGEFDREVRWPKPEQMHLTLKFLGEVRDERVAEISEAAGVAAADSRPFEIRLAGCGCFPPRGRARIVHVGVAEPSGALEDCRDHCEKVFADLGFAAERRPFSPHLTIGRVREDRTDGGLRRAVELISPQAVVQSVDAIYVVQSVLAPTGAQYTNLSRHALSATS